MKLMCSAVMASAAPTRSPSFSRCSSSATMTSLPALRSAIACAMVPNGRMLLPFPARLHQLPDELAEHITFYVYSVTGLELAERRVVPGIRNQGHLHHTGHQNGIDREAYAVHRYRAVRDGQGRELRRHLETDQQRIGLLRHGPDVHHRVHVPLNEM